MTRLAICGLLHGGLVVFALAVVGVAEACPVVPEAQPESIAAGSPSERLTFMSELFESESNATKRWVGAWGSAYAALTVAQLAVVGLLPLEERPDWYWGALSSGLGVAFVVLGTGAVLPNGPRFKARLRGRATPDCSMVAEGELLLREGANEQASSRRWYMHVGNVVFNVGLGLILGLGYGRWTSAAINVLAGTLIGELTLLTSPDQLIRGWQNYVAGRPTSSVSWRVVPLATSAGAGAAVVLQF